MKIIEVQILKTNSEKVQARADIHFEGFWLKGFKILKDSESVKSFVTPPSYLSGHGWRALFKTDTPDDWKEIQNKVLSQFDECQLKEATEEKDI